MRMEADAEGKVMGNVIRTDKAVFAIISSRDGS